MSPSGSGRWAGVGGARLSRLAARGLVFEFPQPPPAEPLQVDAETSNRVARELSARRRAARDNDTRIGSGERALFDRARLDILGALNGESVRMSVNDANSSAVFYDPEDENARFVVMPLRL